MEGRDLDQFWRGGKSLVAKPYEIKIDRDTGKTPKSGNQKGMVARGIVEKTIEGQRVGLLNDFTIEIGEHRYKLAFVDFYRLVEEWMRARDFHQLDWFAKGELVVVKSINLETINEALRSLTERQFFKRITPDTVKQDKNKSKSNSCKYKIIFPEWYRQDIEVRQECQEKGNLDEAIVEFEDGRKYEVYFEDFVSFCQRFAANARRGEVYLAEPGLILVSTVTIEVMQRAVSWLAERDYFDRIEPI